MNEKAILTFSSLVAIVLFAVHWADDIVRGMAPGGFSALFGILILVVWLYGVLVLRGRLLGITITLIGALFAVIALLLHLRGAGLVGGRIANSSGMLLWVLTLIGLGVTGTFSAVLAARELWALRGQRSRTPAAVRMPI